MATNKHLSAAERYLKKASEALLEARLINEYLEVYYDITPKPSEILELGGSNHEVHDTPTWG